MTEGGVVFFAEDQPSATISRWVRAGRATRLGPGVYTTARTSPAQVVAANWRVIVAHEMPGAVVVDRSVPSAGPQQNLLFVDTGPEGRTRPLELPGLAVVPRRGPGPLADDLPLGNGLWLSSQQRALADNTRSTRARGDRPPATLTDDELADWIDHLASGTSPERLAELRVLAEGLAEVTGTTGTIGRMVELIGAALGTRVVETGSERLARRQAGFPYDQGRADLFRRLVDHLRSVAPAPVLEPEAARARFLPFYEAYFSNFIEGTELGVDDAEAVAFRGVVLPNQPEDSHDVAATFRLVTEPEEAHLPSTADDFLALLERRHAILLAARPDKHPGAFKEVGNRAGATTFVHPDLVRGTLRVGWEAITQLGDPYQRAVATMFVVAEVHPFDDGNGRLARIMMNAELTAAGQCRIIVPAVYRMEYLASLSALTNNRRPEPLDQVMGFAQRWTSQVDWTSRASADADLEASNAFVDPGLALREGKKLRLPSGSPAHRRP